MYTTNDFKKNLKIEIKGEPFVIVEAKHVKPGKGVAFVKTKMKSLITGRVLDENFRSGDKVEKPSLEAREMEFLYIETPHYVFMDSSTYEQVSLDENAVTELLPYLKDNIKVDVLFHNDKPISVEPPTFIELLVTETAPGFKGDTVQGGTKPATTETGLVVYVPMYVATGEILKVDTRNGEFVERVKNK